jgi:cell division protein FtsQ
MIGGKRSADVLPRGRGSQTVRRPRRGARRRRRGLGLRRPRPLALLALGAVIALLAGGWVWLRDSPLVAVSHVTVTGASGPDASQIRSALVAEASNMTTLDVRIGELRTAIAPYPVVKDLRVSTQFPHGMRIAVIEHVPVAVVLVAGRTIAVAADGTLLRDVVPSGTLPAITLRVAPGGTHLTGYVRDEVRLVAAAPNQLVPQISQVTDVAAHGLVAQLRNGPSIYFGDTSRLAAKWISAIALLANAGSAGALYIDVTDPQRPAAGAGAESAGADSVGSSAGAELPAAGTTAAESADAATTSSNGG